ncbi:MAG: pyruvate formate lyase family protein [Eubacteriales bacterium]
MHAAAASGKTYADFDEFLEEYLTELRQEVDNSGKAGADFLKVERQGSQDPFASALIENCLEKGLDYFQGGTLMGSPIAIMGEGLGTATRLSLCYQKVRI